MAFGCEKIQELAAYSAGCHAFMLIRVIYSWVDLGQISSKSLQAPKQNGTFSAKRTAKVAFAAVSSKAE